MPRTRTISDERILNTTIELVGLYGVDKLTFALLSAHTELSPATLVQRFGTKQHLLKTVTRHCLHGMAPAFTAARNENHSPLQTIVKAFGSMAGVITSIQSYANGQVFFYFALTDEETNTLLRKSATDALEEIRRLLDKAVEQKELDPCDTAVLALMLQTTYEGAITTWLIYQQGDIETWVTQRLTETIKPYIVIK